MRMKVFMDSAIRNPSASVCKELRRVNDGTDRKGIPSNEQVVSPVRSKTPRATAPPNSVAGTSNGVSRSRPLKDFSIWE
ncbi:MAG: hypothetical protein ISS44_05080 [Candidatus Omnitrophica bacterium]|nr:hypothetical protein [Candidatus Omnitrophota bacterium]